MPTLFVECAQQPRSLRVDRERGVIYGAKLLGWESANGRRYLPEGVDPAMYDGRPLNANHCRPGQERDVRDRIGVIRNPQKRKDGVYGDLHILKAHPLAPAMFEAAERMPNAFGLSHSARGRSRGNVVEGLDDVESVDLVGSPATTRGLHEQRARPQPAGPSLQEQVARYKARERLRDAAERAGVRLSEAVLSVYSPSTDAQARAIVAELRTAHPAQSARTPGGAPKRRNRDGIDRAGAQVRLREVVEHLRYEEPAASRRLAWLMEQMSTPGDPKGRVPEPPNEAGLMGMLDTTGVESGIASPGRKKAHPEEDLRREQLRAKVERLLDDDGLSIDDLVEKLLALLSDKDAATRSDAERDSRASESVMDYLPARVITPAQRTQGARRLMEASRRGKSDNVPKDRSRIGRWLTGGVG